MTVEGEFTPEKMAELLMVMLERDPSMGDECDITVTKIKNMLFIQTDLDADFKITVELDNAGL